MMIRDAGKHFNGLCFLHGIWCSDKAPANWYSFAMDCYYCEECAKETNKRSDFPIMIKVTRPVEPGEIKELFNKAIGLV